MEGSIKHSTNFGVNLDIPLCPHCGFTAEVYRAVRVVGRGRLAWDRHGRMIAPQYDKVDFIPHSDGVRCASCKKLRRDLTADGQEVRKVE